MQEAGTAAPLVTRALQQWYGADPYALQYGLYTYVDPALDAHWRKWNSFKQISRNLANSAIALTGQRDRIQDTAQWWISANAITAVIGYMSVTGDHSYLAPAIENTFAKAPAAPPPNQSGVIDGILHEYNDCNHDGGPADHGAAPGIGTTVFKGIFVRNLARLHARTRKASYGLFILANARSALSHIDENYQFGCNWAAPADEADFVRQTAGLDLVNAALLVGKTDPVNAQQAG